MQKKHNIHTIAEVLIDKLGDMERTASKIEKASKQELKVDLKESKELFGKLAIYVKEQGKVERDILNKLERLQDKNQTRVPNWVLGVLFVFFLGAAGSMWFAYDSVKKSEYLELEKEHYKKLYNGLKGE